MGDDNGRPEFDGQATGIAPEEHDPVLGVLVLVLTVCLLAGLYIAGVVP